MPKGNNLWQKKNGCFAYGFRRFCPLSFDPIHLQLEHYGRRRIIWKMKLCVLWLNKNQRTEPVKAHGPGNKFRNMPPSDTLLPAKPHLVKLTNIPQIPAKERDEHSHTSQRLLDICVWTAIDVNIKDANPKGQCILCKETPPFHTSCLTS